jgi:glycosyltransferase involved in cell wall biosynthesis
MYKVEDMRIAVLASDPVARGYRDYGKAPVVPGLSKLKSFKDEGYEVIFVGFGGKKISDEKTLQFFERNNIEYIHFRTIPTFFPTQPIPLIGRRLDADVVLGGEIFDLFPLLFRLASTPNYYLYTHQNHLSGARKRFYRFFMPIFRFATNRLFKRVVVPVESTRRIWQRMGIKNLAVIPPGIDTEAFKFFENNPSEELKILFVGRVVPEKGVDYLLRAISKLRFPYSLTVAGDGMISYYQGLARKLGCRASFIGPVKYPDLPDLYRKHNVVVLPSVTTPLWKEQFGQVLVEAMATGRIVVGSDCGSIPEVIGEAGFIVPERTVEPLAQVLESIWQDENLFKVMSTRARLRAEKFDVKVVTKKWIKMFEKDLT